MSDSSELIKYAPLVTPLVPAIVDVFIKPKLQKLSKFLKKASTDSLLSVETNFTEYLERSYNKHAVIPILIFQNQQRELKDIYVPLTVRRERENESFKVENYPKDFLPKYRKVLIRDTAGMGKSTLMKRLFLSCLEEQKGIPIFIELRKIKGDDSIVNFIHRELNPINDEFDTDFILNLIRDGNFIFFFDGYDEIAQSERAKVTVNLHDFISKTSNNFFIMTSRPEASLASFPDFMEFDIQPLQLEEAFLLLRKYDRNNELSSEIISKLEGEIINNIKEFLGNPLLVSLLYKSYEYKRTIPLKKHNFYRQVYDALFENHDLTKPHIRDKYSNLDSDSFHAVLRAMSFITIKQGIEYNKDEILSYIRKAKTLLSNIDFKETDFLKDLLQTVPLFSKDGNYYRWSHKSIQDYFTALYIKEDTNERKVELLKKLIRSADNEKYENVLDLFYEIDNKVFRHFIIYEFLEQFSKHYSAAFRFADKKNNKGKDIQDLRLLTFGKLFFLFPQNSMIKSNDFYDADKESYTLSYANQFLYTVNEQLSAELSKYKYFSEGSGNGYSYLGFGNYNFFLTNFLHKKKLNVFYDHEDYDDIRSRNDKPSINIPVDFCVILSENSYTKHINHADLSSINLILTYHSMDTVNRCLLHPDKCLKLKEEIEAEIKREEANELYEIL